MNISRFIQGLVITGIGLGVGIFMAFIMFSTGRLHDRFYSSPRLRKVWDIIHLPAGGIFKLCLWLGLYVAGEEIWLFYLSVGVVVVQWVLVGLGVAVGWYLRGA